MPALEGYGLTLLEALRAELEAAGLSVQARAPLAPHTSLRIGGPADLLAIVTTEAELTTAVAAAERRGAAWWILGGGSNLLISDRGVRGLTILNRCRAWAVRPGQRVWAEGGAPLAGLARATIQAGLSGLEWAVSIPGTVGGAIVGNAGAHGGCMADHLIAVDLLLPPATRVTWPASELALAYRNSRLKDGSLRAVVLGAELQLAVDASGTARQRADEYLAYRRRTQPVEASAGSIFRNPSGDYAGRLIEAAGLKGAREGQAQVSSLHANFIINLGGATAAEVRRLIERVRQRVAEQAGVRLELEIVYQGEWDEG